MPQRTKTITAFPVITLTHSLVPPICVVCLQKIKRGERYYLRKGGETHFDCVKIGE